MPRKKKDPTVSDFMKEYEATFKKAEREERERSIIREKERIEKEKARVAKAEALVSDHVELFKERLLEAASKREVTCRFAWMTIQVNEHLDFDFCELKKRVLDEMSLLGFDARVHTDYDKGWSDPDYSYGPSNTYTVVITKKEEW